MLGRIGLVFLVLFLAAVAVVYWIGQGGLGSHEVPGVIHPERRPAKAVTAAEQATRSGAKSVGARSSKQILFGDLHVHTTFSFDAFMFSMPMVGEGAHPPADACDFARFCSALDFWSINDHAEQITPRHWSETVDSIRQCNAIAGDPDNPDLVSFLGWEWTQVGDNPDNHYGHKNVVLAHTDDARIPTRPIAAGATVRRAQGAIPGTWGRGLLGLFAPEDRYHDLITYFAERSDWDLCDPETHVRDLPDGCLEYADTPADLYRKLDEWGHDSIVIPHGTTWGMYTPPASMWDKQLVGDMHDPDRQTLIEIYSGHGESEVYRDWRALDYAADGSVTCPEPRSNYLPSCWRAGEIIRERCLAEGASASECDARAAKAREHAALAGEQVHLTVPGAEIEDWLDSGQCRDCREPAFNYRPGGSAQYVTAIGNFDSEEPRRFRFGFMASSDNHFARPGTGFKERHRRGFTESGRDGGNSPMARFMARPEEEPVARSRAFDHENTALAGFQLFEFERQASFFLTGGLVAVHAEGRQREAVWDALERREVYGTSGPRILLWFDLLNPPGTSGETIGMGGETEMRDSPVFQARAAGSFDQLDGCPDYAVRALPADRLERLCKNDCYNPSDRRRPITRIEVIRIRPQLRADEPLADLIDDPWRSFPCEAGAQGCVVTFQDPEYAALGRDTVYYVRAFEEPAPAINAAGLRCEYDERGECIEVHPCPGPAGRDDECLAEHEPRAWSSPIFVDFPR